MRIGIATFFKSSNYGAILQAFSLMNRLNDYYDAVLINYDDPFTETGLKSFRFSMSKIGIFNFMNDIYFRNSNKRKLHSINTFFESRYKLSNPYNNTNYINVSKDINVFISGSDQIWNPKLKGKVDEYYFGERLEIPKISYASSFGNYDFDNDSYNRKIFTFLKSYKYVTVREKDSAAFLKKHNIEVKQVLDPVFLTVKSEWKKIMSKRFESEKGKYNVIYCMNNLTSLIENAIKFDLNKKIYVINIDVINFKKFKKYVIPMNDLSPEDFLSILYNANTVITNSFHGIAFSSILEKRCYIHINKTSPQRIISFLSLFDIDIEDKIEIDFKNQQIQTKLKDEIEHSSTLLFDVLRKLNENKNK